MILIAILSIILIWVHASSLRFIIRSGTGSAIIEETKRIEEMMPEEDKKVSLTSGPGLVSLIIIIVLNLIEIGYFVACVYFLGGLTVTIGSSILVGYSFYSITKFIPNIKKFYSSPSEYLKEKTKGFESVLSIIMASIEIVFCIYIVIRIMMFYEIF
ncbi:MAG: hypothetical protein JW997_06155 [Actinobacteria bacterium]|nr:hypothetical protein [Actinomycetota bacterium]